MSELSELMSERAGMAAVAAYEEMARPFYLLKPRVFPDGNAWIAIYGSNIQEGICGCGDTPAAASHDFDNSFFGSKIPVNGGEPTWIQQVAKDVDRQFATLPEWKQKLILTQWITPPETT